MGQADDCKGPCWLLHTCAHAGQGVERSIAETHMVRVPLSQVPGFAPQAWTYHKPRGAGCQARHILVQAVPCSSSAVWP